MNRKILFLSALLMVSIFLLGCTVGQAYFYKLATPKIKQFGKVSISSDPGGANIYINDKLEGIDNYPKGMTPTDGTAASFDFLAGNYYIKLTKEGYDNRIILSKIESGKTTTVNEHLIKEGTMLDIDSTPRGATVYIDDWERSGGVTPYLTPVSDGNHHIRLTLEGFADREEDIYVGPGERKKVVLRMGNYGTISANSDPMGARIYYKTETGITDTRLRTPATFQLLQGDQEIIFSREGYLTKTENVFVVPGMTKTISTTLTKAVKIKASSDPTNIPVFIDGESKGNTPKDILVSEGRHTIKFTYQGNPLIASEEFVGQIAEVKATFASGTRKIEMCTDSDEGRNYYVKGTVTYGQIGHLQTSGDLCGYNTVEESYCKDLNLKKESYPCQYGCSEGVCNGAVSISSTPTPGAQIYVDGVHKGSTDLDVRISSGSHRIKLVKEGYLPYEADIIIVGGRTTDISGNLQPVRPVKVTSNTEGAKVYIDGEEKGAIPSTGSLTIYDVAVGRHTVKLTKDCYTDFTTIIEVDAEEPITETAATLTPLGKGWLSVTSTPSGADIYIDGNLKGTTPTASLLQLCIGSHEIKLTKENCNWAPGTVMIIKDETLSYSATLTCR